MHMDSRGRATSLHPEFGSCQEALYAQEKACIIQQQLVAKQGSQELQPCGPTVLALLALPPP